eukprot:COSAG02_NODE_507_length_20926_cov_1106.169540_4_plen_174_part_00
MRSASAGHTPVKQSQVGDSSNNDRCCYSKRDTLACCLAAALAALLSLLLPSYGALRVGWGGPRYPCGTPANAAPALPVLTKLSMLLCSRGTLGTPKMATPKPTPRTSSHASLSLLAGGLLPTPLYRHLQKYMELRVNYTCNFSCIFKHKTRIVSVNHNIFAIFHLQLSILHLR